jgi:hypothetical protein
LKFGRNYKLIITNPQKEQITVEPPFTIHFTVERNSLATANTGSIELVNLGPSTRNRIYKDRFENSIIWKIELWAGYGDGLFVVLKGNIKEAFSWKDGPNWKTKIEVFDGADAFKEGFVALSYGAKTDKQDIVKRTIETLPGIQTGFLGQYSQGEAPKRGVVVFGPTRKVLHYLTEGHFFIDNEVCHVMSDFEYDGTDTLDLDASQLLQSPQRSDATLNVSILFYPQAKVKAQAVLKSLYPIYNGKYIICGFKHDVMISESENGNATTDLNLLLIKPNGDAAGTIFKALT